MVQRTVGALTAAGLEAVRGLLELLKDSTPAIRLGAIRCALEHGVKLRENADLAERVAALEQQTPGTNG
jgi:hypothetical protein